MLLVRYRVETFWVLRWRQRSNSHRKGCLSPSRVLPSWLRFLSSLPSLFSRTHLLNRTADENNVFRQQTGCRFNSKRRIFRRVWKGWTRQKDFEPPPLFPMFPTSDCQLGAFQPEENAVSCQSVKLHYWLLFVKELIILLVVFVFSYFNSVHQSNILIKLLFFFFRK